MIINSSHKSGSESSDLHGGIPLFFPKMFSSAEVVSSFPSISFPLREVLRWLCTPPSELCAQLVVLMIGKGVGHK